MEYKMLNWHRFGDERGSLVALEAGKDVPFDIKRVFYMSGNVSSSRQRIACACLNASFLLIMLKGSCRVILDDGSQRKEVCLDTPTTGLYISKSLWHEVSGFSEGAVLLVISDSGFIPDDYICRYEDYLNIIRSGTAE